MGKVKERTPEQRAQDEIQNVIVDAIADRTAAISALEDRADSLRAEREALYVRGVEARVPKVRMAAAAKVTPEAIYHAVAKLRKRAEVATDGQ